MSRRGIAPAAGMRLTGSIRETRPKADLAFTDFFEQIRHEQRRCERNCQQNADLYRRH
jgi:hypothetical protein